MDTPNRRAIHAYVSADAHDQWHEFATEHGVMVSALLEVISRRLLPGPAAGSDVVEVDDSIEALVKDARRIDALRRRRS
jgi:hypothetical protein